jgi:hypothetical protein
MHPHPRFAWTDEAEILAFIAGRAFCTIFSADAGPAVFHVPVVVAGPGRLRFHVSRANRGAAGLVGRASSSPAPARIPMSALTGTARPTRFRPGTISPRKPKARPDA